MAQSVLFIHYNIINVIKKGNRIFLFFYFFREWIKKKAKEKRVRLYDSFISFNIG